jgi:hypothetical protein
MLKERPNPKDRPFTFFSLSDDNDAIEWMKQAEEVAPYAAEIDDYVEETKEVLGDQGNAFCYSFGMHLVASLAGAIDDLVLDNLDEACLDVIVLLLKKKISQEKYNNNKKYLSYFLFLTNETKRKYY